MSREKSTENKYEKLETLDSLKNELAPPPGLEERIIRTLRREGLIRVRSLQRKQLIHWMVIAGIAVTFFFVGVVFHDSRTSLSSISVTNKTYVFFLKNGSEYRKALNEIETKERVELYRNWARGLREDGISMKGIKLQSTVRFLGKSPAMTEEILSGYFMIDVASIDEAVRIAQSCPHLLYGGVIEVRPVDPV